MLKLYNYWRSSCSYRVRIALNLKSLPYEYIPVHLPRDREDPRRDELLRLNPQGYVPCLVDGDFVLSQSLAILDYLESLHARPALLPADPRQRAQVWSFCCTIAGDTQPFQNISTLAYLGDALGADDARKSAWLRHWIEKGLAAAEAQLPADDLPFCFGATPTMADACLVPQVYAAKRFGASAERFPRLTAIAQRCLALPAFAEAAPERQPDAPKA